MRILLVEDEQPLAKYVATGLRKHGYAVDIAFDGRTALDKCELTPYDVVVPDRDLPVLHGDAVCRQLAERGTSRILMLTASGAVEDRVDGLTLGADDYLRDPSNMPVVATQPGPLTPHTGHAAVEHGGDVVTADNAEHSDRRRAVASVDELFRGSVLVRSAEDLAEDGVFDDGELEEFLADLGAMRRADLA